MLVNWNGIPHLITISRKLHLKSSSLTPSLNVRDGQSCPLAGRPEDSLRPGSALRPNAHSDQPPSCQLESLSGTSASWHFQIPEFLAAHLRELKDKHFFFFNNKFQKTQETSCNYPIFLCLPTGTISPLECEWVPPWKCSLVFSESTTLWVPVTPCPSCGPGLISHFCLYLSLTASWPLPHTTHPPATLSHLPSPDWPFLNFSKHELVTPILLCLDTFGDAHMADEQVEPDLSSLEYLTERFKNLQAPNFQWATELPSVVSEHLYLEAIFKNRNSNLFPWF